MFYYLFPESQFRTVHFTAVLKFLFNIILFRFFIEQLRLGMVKVLLPFRSTRVIFYFVMHVSQDGRAV